MNKEKIEKIIIEIGDDLIEKNYLDKKNVSLYTGLSGITLFYAYLYLNTKSDKYYNIVGENLEKIIEALDYGYLEPSFSNGISGIFWLFNHLNKLQLLDQEDISFIDSYDAILLKEGKKKVDENCLELLSGATGIGLHFINNPTKKESIEFFNYYVNGLKRYSIVEEERIYWIDVYFNKDLKESTNIGLAHGMGSTLTFLAKLFALGILKKDCKKLIDGMINYYRYIDSKGTLSRSTFPYRVSEFETPINSRLAWCYGDLGIGYSIFLVGSMIGNTSYKDYGIQILINTTKNLDPTENSIIDSDFCHGSMGAAYIYKKMYDYTNKNVFMETSNYWYNHTLNIRSYPEGIAGFKHFTGEEGDGYVAVPGLLEGASGIGLLYLTMLNTELTSWDECLLLS